MSKYTTEVRYICEAAAGLGESAGYGSVNEIVRKAFPKIFDFEFPMYDESYRGVLCTKILKHYYTREIGLETVGLWKLHLDTRMNEIMPYYNQLYRSAVLEFNPLYDVDITTTMDKDSSSVKNVNGENAKTVNMTKETTYGRVVDTSSDGYVQNNGTNKDTSVRKDLFSDTPQGPLENVDNEEYLTNARKNIDNVDGEYSNESTSGGSGQSSESGSDTVANTGTEQTNNSSTDEVNNTEDYILRVSGKRGGVSYSKMLKEFRSTFLNIDKMIIEELADLFMNLW